jgi:ribosomal protein L24E
MDSKDKLILDMLKNGKSYTDIQAELKVSPSRIAIVKKQYLNAPSSTNNALHSDNTNATIQTSEHKTEVKEAQKEVKKQKKESFKDIITTLPDNSTTPNNTTGKSNSVIEWTNLVEKIVDAENIKNSDESVEKNSSTTTDNNNHSTKNNNIPTTPTSKYREENKRGNCNNCGKQLYKGMIIVRSEENGLYFCTRKCFNEYENRKEKEHQRFHHSSLHRKRRRFLNNLKF